MILDKQNQLASAQQITATAPSQNQIDLGPISAAGNAHGTKWPDIVPTVTGDFAGPSGATLTIQLRDALTADMANARVVATSQAIPLADLRVGQRVEWFPILPIHARRFVDANFVVSGGPFTAGSMSLDATMNRQTNR